MIEPLDIPAEFSSLWLLLTKRSTYQIALALFLGANIALVLELAVRRTHWNAWLAAGATPAFDKGYTVRDSKAFYDSIAEEYDQRNSSSLLRTHEQVIRSRKDEIGLQREILLRLLVAEGQLPRKERVFLEYALPDSLAFWELGKLPLNDNVWRAAVRFRYRHVFLLDALPFVDDGIRTESASYQQDLTNKLESIYTALRYTWTSIPPASTTFRAGLILNTLRNIAAGHPKPYRSTAAP